MARFNNMAIVTVAGKRQVRVNVSGKSMFFFDLPTWANHVAIDCCGEVWAFADNPVNSLNCWSSQFGQSHCIGNVGFIKNCKQAYLCVSSAAKEFDAFATGGFVKCDQLTVNADAVKDIIAKKIMPGMAIIGDGFITDDILRYGVEFKAVHNDSGECKIEDMPLAAKVMAVKVDSGDSCEWVDFYYVKNRIEIHDDIVTLLNSQRGFTAEVSFKRGTMVKWEK